MRRGMIFPRSLTKLRRRRTSLKSTRSTLSTQNLQTLRRPNRRRLTGFWADGGMARSFLGFYAQSYSLERDVIVARAAAFFAEGLGGRHGRRRRGAAATHELDALGHHLDDGPLAAVLGFPLARLQPALHENGTALVEVLSTALGLLSPHDDREETDLFTLLAALGRVVTIHGQPQVGDRGSAGSVAKLGLLGEVTDQEDFVEARHLPTSSGDRKSTRLNSSHSSISYAVFCL